MMNGGLHLSPNGGFGAVSHAGCRGHRQPTMCSSGSPPSIQQRFTAETGNLSASADGDPKKPFLLLRREIVDDVYKFYLDVSELCYHSLSVSVKNEEWGSSVVLKGFRRVADVLEKPSGIVSSPFLSFPVVVPCKEGKKVDAECFLISSDGVLEIVVAEMITDGVVPDVERDVPIKRK